MARARNLLGAAGARASAVGEVPAGGGFGTVGRSADFPALAIGRFSQGGGSFALVLERSASAIGTAAWQGTRVNADDADLGARQSPRYLEPAADGRSTLAVRDVGQRD